MKVVVRDTQLNLVYQNGQPPVLYFEVYDVADAEAHLGPKGSWTLPVRPLWGMASIPWRAGSYMQGAPCNSEEDDSWGSWTLEASIHVALRGNNADQLHGTLAVLQVRTSELAGCHRAVKREM